MSFVLVWNIKVADKKDKRYEGFVLLLAFLCYVIALKGLNIVLRIVKDLAISFCKILHYFTQTLYYIIFNSNDN